MNSESAKFFSQFRKIRNKITVAVGGASQHIFHGHQRSQNGAIGFVSAFYKRKNPKLMVEIIHSLPEKKFILLGRNWENYERFHELFAFNNLTYLDVPYSEYPDIYAKMSVFISTSIIEGGPIPLIESMMSNVVPVVTNTGFANDLIKHGENGYIFDTTARVTDVIDLINKAFILETDVRESVLGFTWDAFASEVMSIMNIYSKN
jgi:glycosyltransferase involved in cell wall biosynthesis